MTNQLTICLFILDRSNFTLRFLRYYNYLNFPYKLIIGYGGRHKLNSDIKKEIKKNKNIILKEYPSKNYDHDEFFKRIVICLKLVKTKYVKLISDDDFFFETSTLKCIEFLNKNPSFDAAGGCNIGFYLKKKYYGEISDINYFYYIKNNYNQNKLEKLKALYKEYYDIWHIVFKTKKILKLYEDSSRLAPNDAFFKEEFHETNVRLSSKIYFFKDPMNFHEHHTDSHMATNRGTIIDRMSDPSFYQNLKIMSQNLNKLHRTIQPKTIYNEFYKSFITKDLSSFHNKSYYSKNDIFKLIINNLKTKFKRNTKVQDSLNKIKDNKLKLEIIKIKQFLVEFDITKK